MIVEKRLLYVLTSPVFAHCSGISLQKSSRELLLCVEVSSLFLLTAISFHLAALLRSPLGLRQPFRGAENTVSEGVLLSIPVPDGVHLFGPICYNYQVVFIR